MWQYGCDKDKGENSFRANYEYHIWEGKRSNTIFTWCQKTPASKRKVWVEQILFWREIFGDSIPEPECKDFTSTRGAVHYKGVHIISTPRIRKDREIIAAYLAKLLNLAEDKEHM
jgi:hypothetical protein